VLLKQLAVNFSDGLFGIEDSCKIEWNSHVDICRGGRIAAHVFEKEFWFRKVKVLHIHEL
jgi:hypothetical protein